MQQNGSLADGAGMPCPIIAVVILCHSLQRHPGWPQARPWCLGGEWVNSPPLPSPPAPARSPPGTPRGGGGGGVRPGCPSR